MFFPTTENQIRAAEHALSIKLPQEYRQRLMARNGGEITTAGDDWRVFPVVDSTQPAQAKGPDIVQATQKARATHGFPKDAVAIATNGKGDYLVLMPASATHLGAQVQVWRQETLKLTPSALSYEN